MVTAAAEGLLVGYVTVKVIDTVTEAANAQRLYIMNVSPLLKVNSMPLLSNDTKLVDVS